ncbi:MAG: cytochrome b/b6 domain-containing protein [Marinilabiliales bacterium]|nr:cytochrome b/b6 domain-containing protein [Marinilabiliales bacterium]
MNSSTSQNSLFIQPHSAAIRVWHWLTFLLILALIVTVWMNATLLNARQSTPAIVSTLQEKGVTATPAQAWSVAHYYGEKMWDVHKILGFMLAFLLLARVIIEFRQPAEEKIGPRLKSALFGYLETNHAGKKKDLRHFLIVKYSYTLFYGLLFVMATTGILVAAGGELGLEGATRHAIKEVHGFVSYLIYLFVFFHLAGVIRSELGRDKGIVSGMIHGKGK